MRGRYARIDRGGSRATRMPFPMEKLGATCLSERFDHDRAVADRASLQGGDVRAQRLVQANEKPGVRDLRLAGLWIVRRHGSEIG